MKKRLNNDIPPYYIERINRLLRLCSDYNILKNGDAIIEIGTGWLHWEAASIKLFFDIQAILFDIWDNRQFEALKHYFNILDKMLDNEIQFSNTQRSRAHKIISQIISADSLDILYEQLRFKYVTDSCGRLRRFPDKSFNVVISAGVLEHVREDGISELIQDFYRVLKPGGYSVHSINMGDHLFAYDTNVSRKEYLRFSDNIWKIFFQNDVQYINRVQRSEWLDLFNNVEFRLINEETEYSNMDNLKIHKQFKHLDKADVESTLLRIVHQRPY
jgi:predicted SAM-dependent methyltransferase